MDHPNPTTKASLACTMLCTALWLGACASSETKQKPVPPPAPPKPVPQVLAEPLPWNCPSETGARSKHKKTVKPQDCGPPPPPVPVVVTPIPTPASLDVLTGQTYDLSRNTPITDSRNAQPGQGTVVIGLNDWQGEVSGLPAADSKFAKLKIGMPRHEATRLIGPPDDQGAQATERSFFSYFRRSNRWEAVYAGQGRLIFSSQVSWWGSGELYLTWIIHNPNEGTSR